MAVHQLRIHQDGRHNARPPGHEVSWTGYTIAHPSILPAAFSPTTAPVATSLISPRTSGRSAAHPEAHHHSLPTGLYTAVINAAENPAADPKPKPWQISRNSYDT